MVRAIKKQTTNPRSRIACRYDLIGLSPDEYNTILEGLRLINNEAGAELLKTLEDLDKEEGASL